MMSERHPNLLNLYNDQKTPFDVFAGRRRGIVATNGTRKILKLRPSVNPLNFIAHQEGNDLVLALEPVSEDRSEQLLFRTSHLSLLT